MASDEDVAEVRRLPDLSCLRSHDEVIIKMSTYKSAWQLLPEEHREELEREYNYHGEDHVRLSPEYYDRLCDLLMDAVKG